MPELTQAELESEARRLFDVGLDPRSAPEDKQAALDRLTSLRAELDPRAIRRAADAAKANALAKTPPRRARPVRVTAGAA